jgi:hypothetical protein
VLIIALVLAVIGLAALVTAVVTSNEVIAWVCIGASVIGVLLLIVDALRERKRGASSEDSDDSEGVDEQTAVFAESEFAEDYPDEPTSQFAAAHDESDDARYSDETGYSDETAAFESAATSPEGDTTALAVDDEAPAEAPADESSDSDDPTKRN